MLRADRDDAAGTSLRVYLHAHSGTSQVDECPLGSVVVVFLLHKNAESYIELVLNLFKKAG